MAVLLAKALLGMPSTALAKEVLKYPSPERVVARTILDDTAERLVWESLLDYQHPDGQQFDFQFKESYFDNSSLDQIVLGARSPYLFSEKLQISEVIEIQNETRSWGSTSIIDLYLIRSLQLRSGYFIDLEKNGLFAGGKVNWPMLTIDGEAWFDFTSNKPHLQGYAAYFVNGDEGVYLSIGGSTFNQFASLAAGAVTPYSSMYGGGRVYSNGKISFEWFYAAHGTAKDRAFHEYKLAQLSGAGLREITPSSVLDGIRELPFKYVQPGNDLLHLQLQHEPNKNTRLQGALVARSFWNLALGTVAGISHDLETTQSGVELGGLFYTHLLYGKLLGEGLHLQVEVRYNFSTRAVNSVVIIDYNNAFR